MHPSAGLTDGASPAVRTPRPTPLGSALAWVTSTSVPSSLPSGSMWVLEMGIFQRAPGAVLLWFGFEEGTLRGQGRKRDSNLNFFMRKYR